MRVGGLRYLPDVQDTCRSENVCGRDETPDARHRGSRLFGAGRATGAESILAVHPYPLPSRGFEGLRLTPVSGGPHLARRSAPRPQRRWWSWAVTTSRSLTRNAAARAGAVLEHRGSAHVGGRHRRGLSCRGRPHSAGIIRTLSARGGQPTCGARDCAANGGSGVPGDVLKDGG